MHRRVQALVVPAAMPLGHEWLQKAAARQIVGSGWKMKGRKERQVTSSRILLERRRSGRSRLQRRAPAAEGADEPPDGRLLLPWGLPAPLAGLLIAGRIEGTAAAAGGTSQRHHEGVNRPRHQSQMLREPRHAQRLAASQARVELLNVFMQLPFGRLCLQDQQLPGHVRL